MEEACERAGRRRKEVKLIAVSKTHGPDKVDEAVEAGLTLFGENRVQEAAAKIPRCSTKAEWHLIGHLQSNKVKMAVPLFHMIHSIDSEKLLCTVNSVCRDRGVTMPVLLQINVSGEASKFGMAPEMLEPVLETAATCMNVDVLGLMTIPPLSADESKTRCYFAELRGLRDCAAEKSGFPLEELSMGMSHDFTLAIKEGATYIRIGTRLFGERGKPWALKT